MQPGGEGVVFCHGDSHLLLPEISKRYISHTFFFIFIIFSRLDRLLFTQPLSVSHHILIFSCGSNLTMLVQINLQFEIGFYVADDVQQSFMQLCELFCKNLRQGNDFHIQLYFVFLPLTSRFILHSASNKSKRKSCLFGFCFFCFQSHIIYFSSLCILTQKGGTNHLALCDFFFILF